MKRIFIITILIFILSIFYSYGDCSEFNNATAYYSMDTDMTDDSDNSYDGSVTGATHTNSGCRLGGGCYSLDGNDDYLSMDALAPVSAGDNIGCLNFWFKSTTGVYTLTANDYSDSGDYYTIGEIDTGNNYLKSDAGDEIHRWTGCTGNWDDGNWHFVTLCSRGTTEYFFMDGNNCTMTFSQGSNDGFWFNDLGAGQDTLTLGCLNRQSGGCIGDFTGHFDEFSYYDYYTSEWGGRLHAALYNGGSGCNPYDTEDTASLTLTTNLSTGKYTDNPFFLSFSGEVQHTQDDNFNCTLYLNGTVYLNESISNISLTTVWNITTTGFEEGYDFNLSCLNNNATDSNFTTNIFIDTIQPQIFIYEFNETKIYYTDTDYSLNLFTNDTNNAGINITIFKNSSGILSLVWEYYQENLTVNEFNFTNTTNSSEWCSTSECKFLQKVMSWDDHNPLHNKKEKEKAIITKKFNNSEIKFKKGFLNIEEEKKSNHEIIESDTKYHLKFKNKGNQKIILSSDYGKGYIRKSKHKGHIYFPKIKKYFDLDSDCVEKIKIMKQNEKFIITFKTTENECLTQSIGDLNVNEDSLEFTLIERPSTTDLLLTELLNKTDTQITLISDEMGDLNMGIINFGLMFFWIALWVFGYYAFQSFNEFVGFIMILMTLPIDIYFLVNLIESNFLGSGFIGIAFGIVIPFTLGALILIRRKKYKNIY